MTVHALAIVFALSVPYQTRATNYVVQRGDSLGQIAARYQVSVQALASANGITNANFIRTGRVLAVPGVTAVTAAPSYVPAAGSYRVQWGDTLIGLAARFRVSIAEIRALNPSMGRYPIAGQWLNLCSPCSSQGLSAPASYSSPSTSGAPSASGAGYLVQAGDTLSAIAARYGVSIEALQTANHIANANSVVAGSRLVIPSGGTVSANGSWEARSLISTYAQQYGLAPALPLSIGAHESGYNQAALSRTGAIGVMQVEPFTGTQISALLGRPVNLYALDDNIHAGVFWLAHLLNYYHGDERLAVAAYYQGTDGLARHGFFQDTTQYVNNVMSLKTRLGG